MAAPDDKTLRARRVRRVHTLFDPPAISARPDMAPWRRKVNAVIFQADTPVGRAFDWMLLVLIALSVTAVLAESVPEIRAHHGLWLRDLEWGLTLIFTAEYVARVSTAGRPWGYVFSFFGLVDLLSVAPTWLSLATEGSQVLAVVRVLRMLRVFRLLQLSQFAGEAARLAAALWASTSRIAVFLFTVMTLVIIMGSTMYLVEGAEAGFDSIPRSIYWAIVTLTTVGYGDIAPRTAIGQAIAAAVMILGYAIIAVPTGIVSVEMVRSAHEDEPLFHRRDCPSCGQHGHEAAASFCWRCGEAMNRAFGPDPAAASSPQTPDQHQGRSEGPNKP